MNTDAAIDELLAEIKQLREYQADTADRFLAVVRQRVAAEAQAAKWEEAFRGERGKLSAMRQSLDTMEAVLNFWKIICKATPDLAGVIDRLAGAMAQIREKTEGIKSIGDCQWEWKDLVEVCIEVQKLASGALGRGSAE